MAVLSCENLCLAYENKIAVSGLSFSLEAGEYLCIVGENGSGKSTLIKALLGLKQPKSGKISLSDGVKHTEIGYLPQQTPAQKDFPASVWEVVLSGCLNAKGIISFYTRKDRQRAMENLEKLGISDLKNACYRELSGGQQQRVLLARALCATRKMLLLDEPVTGLDPIATAEFYSLIRDLNKKDGVTVIMVSHDLHAAIENADKILQLRCEPLYYGPAAGYAESEPGKKLLGGDGNACHH